MVSSLVYLGANIGVLIGIVLVLVELDQNRDMMRAQTRQELAMGIVDLLQTPANNEQLADLMYRAHTGGDGMIARSSGHSDAIEYQQQLQHGAKLD